MATGTTLGSVFLPQDAKAWPKPSAPAQRKPTRQHAKERLSKSLSRPASEDAASTDANSTAPPDSQSQPDSEDVLVDIDPAEGRRRGEHLMSMLHLPVSTAADFGSFVKAAMPLSTAAGQHCTTPARLRCKSAPAMLRFYGADSNCYLASAPKEPQPYQSSAGGPVGHTRSVPVGYVICMVPLGKPSPTLPSCTPGPNNQTQPLQLPMAEVRLTPEDQTFNVASLPDKPRHVVLIDAEAKPEDHFKLSEEARAATVVAFDAEWKPDLGGSDNPIAVLQLAFPDSMAVYVVHVAALGGFPTDVEEMMQSPDVKKIGFAIGQDLRKFKTSNLAVNDALGIGSTARTFAIGQDLRKSISDVSDDCHAALGIGSTVSLGLAWAAQEILWYEMKKSKEITCSNWANQRLTIEQIEYAAMDAWVTLRLYQALRRP